MSRRTLRWTAVTVAAFSALAAALVVAMATGGSSSARSVPKLAASASEPDASAAQRQSSGGEAVTYEAYRAATRAYPAAAENVPLQWVKNASDSYQGISKRTAKTPPNPGLLNTWQQYGPQQYASYPGLLDYGGVGYHASGRIVALAISNSCNIDSGCVMYAGPNGGGIWKTGNALVPDPVWTQLAPFSFAQVTVGDIIIDPNDFTENTIYVGTGEPNACSSGCPAGAGLYRSTNGGASFTKLAGACASNGTYTCISAGKDSFLGRGISEIVVDPADSSHLLVGSATAVRGLSHLIGLGGQRRFDEPGPNAPGLYESFNGGATFTPAWIPLYPYPTGAAALAAAAGRRGVIDVGLDPNDTRVVYASSFDKGVYRRCATVASFAACNGESAANAYDWKQVFAPRFPGQGGSDVERTMFDLTTAPNNSNATRIYLTTGRGSTAAPYPGESSSSFWRTDNANQTAAALLATEPAAGAFAPGCNATSCPGPADAVGTVYNGWRILTSPTFPGAANQIGQPGFTSSPYWATHNFCTAQCWYDQDVMTPHNPPRPNEVYVIGSYNYGEMTCRTKGTNFCASGVSNTRGILYSNTAGASDAANGGRTFTDMTWDAQNKASSSPWCAYPGISTCDVAQDAQHPDQHEIIVNPAKASQFWESSDGGIVRSDGRYTNLSRACSFRAQPDAGIPGLSGNSLTQCQRLLSRVPTELEHTNQNIGSTLQFINVAANPMNPCQMIGGTQDNGTWMPGPYNSGCDVNEWFTKIYGDGGWAGFDSHPDQSVSSTGQPWVFNQFTSPTIDANFRNGDTLSWVVTSGQIANGPATGFYQPQIADPNPPLFAGARTHPIFVAQLNVWRSWAFGAGRPISNPQQTEPAVAYYEANCPEFFTSSGDPNCGDYQSLAGPAVLNGPADLTGSNYGADRASAPGIGRGISGIARRGADFNTMWATTATGRVFVTANANATDPATVVWKRVDNLPTPSNPCAANTQPNCSPDRFPAGIYPDPYNVNVAYIAYSGYNSATPSALGHVFRVTVSPSISAPTGVVFKDLGVESGLSNYPTPNGAGDLPANDVVMDDFSCKLYVATDFGVLVGTPSSCPATAATTWTWSTTSGMPRYEVAHLALVGGQRDACRPDLPAAAPVCGNLLLAATHSQGIWVNRLG